MDSTPLTVELLRGRVVLSRGVDGHDIAVGQRVGANQRGARATTVLADFVARKLMPISSTALEDLKRREYRA